MFRNSRTILTGLCLAVIAVVVTMIGCANPVDQEPLRWTTAMEVPVTNHEFHFGELLGNLFEMGDLAIINSEYMFFDNELQMIQ